jgi:hypothetical protein
MNSGFQLAPRRSGSQRSFGMGIVLAVGYLLVPCGVLAQVPAAPLACARSAGDVRRNA